LAAFKPSALSPPRKESVHRVEYLYGGRKMNLSLIPGNIPATLLMAHKILCAVPDGVLKSYFLH
jgi:hypothetical protein